MIDDESGESMEPMEEVPLIGHAQQRHDLIGCIETRTTGARRVRDTCTPMRLLALEFVNWSSVQL